MLLIALTRGPAHAPLLAPPLLQVGAGAQAGPSAAGCPVGCLPSCRHAADVRGRGGEREEWLRAHGVRKQTAEANECQVCSSDNPAANTPAAARRLTGRRSPFSAYFMGQRKGRKPQGRLPLLSPALLLYFHRLVRHTAGLGNAPQRPGALVFEGGVCELAPISRRSGHFRRRSREQSAEEKRRSSGFISPCRRRATT